MITVRQFPEVRVGFASKLRFGTWKTVRADKTFADVHVLCCAASCLASSLLGPCQGLSQARTNANQSRGMQTLAMMKDMAFNTCPWSHAHTMCKCDPVTEM